MCQEYEEKSYNTVSFFCEPKAPLKSTEKEKRDHCEESLWNSIATSEEICNLERSLD